MFASGSPAVVVFGGGPTSVINATFYGIAHEARLHGVQLYGAKHGHTGILSQDLFDISRETLDDLRAIADKPSAELGSTRKKVTQMDCLRMFRVLRAHGITVFFYIGGNDTAESVRIIAEIATAESYPLICIHVPKTIDNDLAGSHHTPGYASAALHVMRRVRYLAEDSRAFGRVHVIVTQGRESGWLAGACALCGADLVYVPERPFSVDRFLEDVASVHRMRGHCVIGVSEGLKDQDGEVLLKRLTKSMQFDAHDNPRLASSGELANWLCASIEKTLAFETQQDVLGYSQRCDPRSVCERDREEAEEVGRHAVRVAAIGSSGSIVIKGGHSARRCKARFDVAPLNAVAKLVRQLPPEFINDDGNGMTAAFCEYLRELVGDIPKSFPSLTRYPVKRRLN